MATAQFIALKKELDAEDAYPLFKEMLEVGCFSYWLTEVKMSWLSSQPLNILKKLKQKIGYFQLKIQINYFLTVVSDEAEGLSLEMLFENTNEISKDSRQAFFEYLLTLKNTLSQLINEIQPDIIFYLSGVDVLYNDKLGRLGMSKQGCKERDEFVFKQAKENNIPIAVSMGGGYSEQLADIIEAYSNTFRVAKDVFDF